jgi:hypothetical protein
MGFSEGGGGGYVNKEGSWGEEDEPRVGGQKRKGATLGSRGNRSPTLGSKGPGKVWKNKGQGGG